MQNVNRKITGKYSLSEADSSDKQKINIIKNTPSISAIRELNSIRQLSNIIWITDRNDYPLAEIRTTHNIIKLDELNDLLLKTLVHTEDKIFYKIDSIPQDTTGLETVLSCDSVFREPGSKFITSLYTGDTLITNIRYRYNSNGSIRRFI